MFILKIFVQQKFAQKVGIYGCLLNPDRVSWIRIQESIKCTDLLNLDPQHCIQEDKRDLNDGSDLHYCGNEWKYPTGCNLQVNRDLVI